MLHIKNEISVETIEDYTKRIVRIKIYFPFELYRKVIKKYTDEGYTPLYNTLNAEDYDTKEKLKCIVARYNTAYIREIKDSYILHNADNLSMEFEKVIKE